MLPAALYLAALGSLVQPPRPPLAAPRPLGAPRAPAPLLAAELRPAHMPRRSRQRRRGKATAERAAEADVVRPSGESARSLPFRYLCVCDVEATCDRNTKFADFAHEIIEFPVVVVDLEAGGGVVDEFQSYVRPTQNATLSAFCTELTGITQRQVDEAPALPQVLEAFERWRLERGYLGDAEARDFAFGTDGPWDLRFFLHGECARKGLPKPAYYDKWVNIKQLFADHYGKRPCKIHKMLQLQGMRFEGRLHSGIDDTRNIARIALKMRDDGCTFYLNEALPPRQRAGFEMSSLVGRGTSGGAKK